MGQVRNDGGGVWRADWQGLLRCAVWANCFRDRALNRRAYLGDDECTRLRMCSEDPRTKARIRGCPDVRATCAPGPYRSTGVCAEEKRITGGRDPADESGSCRNVGSCAEASGFVQKRSKSVQTTLARAQMTRACVRTGLTQQAAARTRADGPRTCSTLRVQTRSRRCRRLA
jgi:hypothetical protein